MHIIKYPHEQNQDAESEAPGRGRGDRKPERADSRGGSGLQCTPADCRYSSGCLGFAPRVGTG